MTSLAQSNSAVGWKDGAEVGAATAAGGGVLWAIFRFLVGSIVADKLSGLSKEAQSLSNDIAVLKNDIQTLRESNHDLADRLNTVFEKMIETRQ